MMNFLLRIWKDPVWSKVIATCIVAGAIWLWSTLNTSSFINTLFFLNTTYPTPLWLLILLGVCTVVLIFRLISKKKKVTIVPTPLVSNTSDIFAILDHWWPKAEGQNPSDVAVVFSDLEKELNLKTGSVQISIEAVAIANCYKKRFIGNNNATFEYDFDKAFSSNVITY
ncbi:hypothetical protein [Deefgea rivuli]|uniref:hypothetical protein n=1 Tax=Deefgea rivuli TaxID=400948 RepID=UPI000488A09D|nr:hypothetical protein [Deefgea rivuli]